MATVVVLATSIAVVGDLREVVTERGTFDTNYRLPFEMPVTVKVKDGAGLAHEAEIDRILLVDDTFVVEVVIQEE